MNSTRLIPFALTLSTFGSLVASVSADPNPSPRLTATELAARGRERPNPLAGHRGVEEIDHTAVQKKKERGTLGAGSLLSRSMILSFRGTWTIVPKGALLHVPAAYQDRIVARPDGRLIPWKEFYVRNRGWIHTQNVTFENARGESALSPEILELHKKLGRVVVAVLHQGPISVKAPVEPKDEEQKGKSPGAPVDAVVANTTAPSR